MGIFYIFFFKDRYDKYYCYLTFVRFTVILPMYLYQISVLPYVVTPNPYLECLYFTFFSLCLFHV